MRGPGEAGLKVKESVPELAQWCLDPQGRVARDVPCIECGYNLRTLTPASSCPECGEAVAASLVRSRLCFAQPVWLGRVRAGAWTLMAAALCTILAPLMCGGLLVIPIWLIGGGLLVVSGGPIDEADDRLRRRVQWWLLASLAAAVAAVGLAAFPWPISLILLLAGNAAWLIYLLAMLAYVGRLAALLDRPRLGKHPQRAWITTAGGWGLALLAVLLTVLYLDTGTPHDTLQTTLLLVWVGALLTLAVALGIDAVLFGRLALRLGKTRRVALCIRGR